MASTRTSTKAVRNLSPLIFADSIRDQFLDVHDILSDTFNVFQKRFGPGTIARASGNRVA